MSDVSQHAAVCGATLPAGLTLSSDEVHVWRASLNPTGSHLQFLEQTLAADELSRAKRFHFEQDRKHFIAARGLLRVILSQYLDVEPGQLRFCYSCYGKPMLVTSSGQKALSFNVSHAQGLALFAFTRDREIGIDLERIRPEVECEQIAARFFSSLECATLRALPPAAQQAAFFSCWTRKEAYIKARGEGLSLALDQFDVSLRPDEPAALSNTRPDPQEASRWSLQELDPGPGYVGALAVSGDGWQLKFRQWPIS